MPGILLGKEFVICPIRDQRSYGVCIARLDPPLKGRDCGGHPVQIIKRLKRHEVQDTFMLDEVIKPMPFNILSSNHDMTNDEFKLFKLLVCNESGIDLKPAKKAFLQNRIMKRMMAKGIKSYYSYYKLITGNGRDKDELLALLDTLTINETSFFRNKPQLDLFHRYVLPEILSRKRAKADFCLKIWSAGCSTGQEPYTIAMLLNDVIADIKYWKIAILATDLSMSVLKTAQHGVYPESKMEGVDEVHMRRYFIERRGNFHVKDELKKLIAFDFHNLIYDNRITNIDVIFCRNVFIYFDAQTQRNVVERLYQCLAPNGYIFTGHTESLQGLSKNLIFIHRNKGTVYQRKT